MASLKIDQIISANKKGAEIGARFAMQFAALTNLQPVFNAA